ncbi:MAG TPA: hypothetical protein VGC54_10610 [Planctomycetota bacterium]
MDKKAPFLAIAVFFLAAVLLFLPSCCASTQELVVIASPETRYDHNRQQLPQDWSLTIGAATETLVVPNLAQDRALAVPPPAWVPHSGDTGADGLPQARLSVLFSGLALPLQNAGEQAEEVSDRDDLSDFLGSGSLAKTGLEAGDMMGAAREEVERDYGAILGMLAAPATLAGMEAVLAWADEHGATTTFRIVDSRFPVTAFKNDRIAVAWGEFWFVLFAIPGSSGYSRLVVVPNPPGDQDFAGKRPAGS